ncbi:MAG: hypothetical protein KDB86_05705 [Actinobacteria bacterium]|nr:hypothetical protein [Actinomycetota bacterium]
MNTFKPYGLPRRAALWGAVALALLLTSCSSRESTAAPTTTTGAAVATTTASKTPEFPVDCRPQVVEWLRDLEDAYQGVDLTTLTWGQSKQIDATLADTTDPVGSCVWEPGIDQGGIRTALVALAESDAPGAVAFLKFSFNTGDAVQAGVESDQAPQTCEQATTTVVTMMGDAETIDDLLFADALSILATANTIGGLCTPEEATAFSNQHEAFFTPTEANP